MRAARPAVDPAWVEYVFDKIALLVAEGDAAGLAAAVAELAGGRTAVVEASAESSSGARPPRLSWLGSMVLFAFSVQDQVEKYGAYVGIAAFFGLAILSLLYFAQAREVKRLREWAGRAPERAAELEQAVAEHAQEARRGPPDAGAAAAAGRVPAAGGRRAANGVVKLKPAEVAALAFARAAGVHEPHEPTPHPVPGGRAGRDARPSPPRRSPSRRRCSTAAATARRPPRSRRRRPRPPRAATSPRRRRCRRAARPPPARRPAPPRRRRARATRARS